MCKRNLNVEQLERKDLSAGLNDYGPLDAQITTDVEEQVIAGDNVATDLSAVGNVTGTVLDDI